MLVTRLLSRSASDGTVVAVMNRERSRMRESDKEVAVVVVTVAMMW